MAWNERFHELIKRFFTALVSPTLPQAGLASARAASLYYMVK
jgi:hypothetical protein